MSHRKDNTLQGSYEGEAYAAEKAYYAEMTKANGADIVAAERPNTLHEQLRFIRNHLERHDKSDAELHAHLAALNERIARIERTIGE